MKTGLADLERWLGLAANCAGRPIPQLRLDHRDRTFKLFFERCTPENIANLLRAHLAAIEAMQELVRRLGRLSCICPAAQTGHHPACPKATLAFLEQTFA